MARGCRWQWRYREGVEHDEVVVVRHVKTELQFRHRVGQLTREGGATTLVQVLPKMLDCFGKLERCDNGGFKSMTIWRRWCVTVTDECSGGRRRAWLFWRWAWLHVVLRLLQMRAGADYFGSNDVMVMMARQSKCEL